MIDHNYKGHNIVFIVGSPRSGTTWLQRLLASHPQMHTGQESDIFDGYIGPQLRYWRRFSQPHASGRSVIGLACYLTEEEFLQVLKEYMLKLLEPMVGGLQEGELFLEKTPSHALFLSEIMELLPEARVIHMLRDARDVVASLLAASKSWGARWAPKTAGSAAHMWRRHVQAFREASQKSSEEQFYEIRYEDMSARPANTLKEVVFQFLKLEWNEADIKQAIERNRFDKAKETMGGTAIPVGGEFARTLGSVLREPSGFVRKARPGSWKEDLPWIGKICVWLVARKTMKEVGYHWTFPW